MGNDRRVRWIRQSTLGHFAEKRNKEVSNMNTITKAALVGEATSRGALVGSIAARLLLDPVVSIKGYGRRG
jgi:hypothetical protein